MIVSARLQSFPSSDRRDTHRHTLRLGSTLPTHGENVTVHDVSPTGMLIETEAELAPFDRLEIDLPEVGITQAFVVWSSGQFYGCEFEEPLSQSAISSARLRSPPAIPLQATPSPVEITDLGADGDEEKASLTVRLRVLIGATVLLWSLIVWGVWSLIAAFG